MVEPAAIEAGWARAEWAADEVEPGIWRSTFSTEREEDFDVYVMLGDGWVHFAVSPLVRGSEEAARRDYYATLLVANQNLRLARFALDGDGDTSLLVDLPHKGFSPDLFASTIDLLVEYTNELAYELRRTAHEPGYRSPRLPRL